MGCALLHGNADSMHAYVLCLHRCSGASWLLPENPWTGGSLSNRGIQDRHSVRWQLPEVCLGRDHTLSGVDLQRQLQW